MRRGERHDGCARRPAWRVARAAGTDSHAGQPSAPDERLRDIDERRARAYVDWLCRLTDEDGHRLTDRSVRNAVLPLQSCLRHAVRAGLLRDGAEPVILLPRRRRGRGSTSVASSHASSSRGRWPRSQTNGGRSSNCWPRPVCGSPRRSPCGSWTPTSTQRSRGSTCAARSSTASSPAPSRGTADARSRSATRSPRGCQRSSSDVATRSCCCRRSGRAALLIDAGASPLRLQRWMGHHSAAFTLDKYGHLFDDSLGPTSAWQSTDPGL